MVNFYLIPPVRSKLIRDFPDPSKNGGIRVPCTAQIPGICNHDWSTCVWCHFETPKHKAMKGKASDLNGAACCSACHDLLDMRDSRWVDYKDDFEFYKRRAINRSLHMLLDAGIITVKGHKT